MTLTAAGATEGVACALGLVSGGADDGLLGAAAVADGPTALVTPFPAEMTAVAPSAGPASGGIRATARTAGFPRFAETRGNAETGDFRADSGRSAPSRELPRVEAPAACVARPPRMCRAPSPSPSPARGAVRRLRTSTTGGFLFPSGGIPEAWRRQRFPPPGTPRVTTRWTCTRGGSAAGSSRRGSRTCACSGTAAASRARRRGALVGPGAASCRRRRRAGSRPSRWPRARVLRVLRVPKVPRARTSRGSSRRREASRCTYRRRYRALIPRDVVSGWDSTLTLLGEHQRRGDGGAGWTGDAHFFWCFFGDGVAVPARSVSSALAVCEILPPAAATTMNDDRRRRVRVVFIVAFGVGRHERIIRRIRRVPDERPTGAPAHASRRPRGARRFQSRPRRAVRRTGFRLPILHAPPRAPRPSPRPTDVRGGHGRLDRRDARPALRGRPNLGCRFGTIGPTSAAWASAATVRCVAPGRAPGPAPASVLGTSFDSQVAVTFRDPVVDATKGGVVRVASRSGGSSTLVVVRSGYADRRRRNPSSRRSSASAAADTHVRRVRRVPRVPRVRGCRGAYAGLNSGCGGRLGAGAGAVVARFNVPAPGDRFESFGGVAFRVVALGFDAETFAHGGDRPKPRRLRGRSRRPVTLGVPGGGGFDRGSVPGRPRRRRRRSRGGERGGRRAGHRTRRARSVVVSRRRFSSLPVRLRAIGGCDERGVVRRRRLRDAAARRGEREAGGELPRRARSAPPSTAFGSSRGRRRRRRAGRFRFRTARPW